LRTFFGQEEVSSDADVHTLFGAKNIGFFEIYGVSARAAEGVRELSQCGHFSVKGGGQFLRFCDVLHGRQLQLVQQSIKNSNKVPILHVELWDMEQRSMYLTTWPKSEEQLTVFLQNRPPILPEFSNY